MISVTVAANNAQRGSHPRVVVGSHLKAYGAGRLSIVDLNKEYEPLHKTHLPVKSRWRRLFVKLFSLFTATLKFLFPFLFWYNKKNPELTLKQFVRLKSSHNIYRPIERLSDELLVKVFEYLEDPSDVIACELVSKKWARIVQAAGGKLAKFQIDQMRMLFDEGEILMYPWDEKRSPVRHAMPSLQELSRSLCHLRTSSLFIRGLLPIESDPVLRSLSTLSLMPQQIYFVWCQFSQESINLLSNFLNTNVGTMNDLGFEDCSPINLISDELIEPILPNLTNLRIWNDGKSGEYPISDATIYEISKSITNGQRVESIDLAACTVTHHSIFHLIITWMTQSTNSDLSITINYCPGFDRHQLLCALSQRQVYFENGAIRCNGCCFRLYC